MVINKKASKIQKFFVLQATFFSLQFVGIFFVSSIILSHVITESSVILAKDLLFSQLDAARLQI